MILQKDAMTYKYYYNKGAVLNNCFNKIWMNSIKIVKNIYWFNFFFSQEFIQGLFHDDLFIYSIVAV